MRTALAALCLAFVVILAVIAVSFVSGRIRVEFGDPPPMRAEAPAAPEAQETQAYEPVADAPDFLPEPVSEPGPAPEIAASEPPPPVASVLAEPAPAPAPAEPIVAEPVVPVPAARAPRVVGGPGITPGPSSGAGLEREAAPPRPPEPVKWHAFRRVTVVAANRLDLGQREVELPGVVLPAAESQCRLATGSAERPCAFLALQAMRQRIRGRGVECSLSLGEAAETSVVPCRIGTTDLSLWLIEQGWAEAAPDAPEAYPAAEIEARCAGKGIWLGGERPAGCPPG